MPEYKKNNVDKRQNKYVDRLVQGTLIWRMVIHWTAYLIATFVIVTGLTWMLHPFAGLSDIAWRILSGQGPSFLVGLLLVPIFVRDTLDLTHRMVGPMVQIREQLTQLAQGAPAADVHFRPDDFWHEVGQEFNGMCAVVNPIFQSPPMDSSLEAARSPIQFTETS